MQQSVDIKANSKLNEKYIIKKCSDLLKEAEIKKSPVDLKLLASYRGIVRVEEEESLKEAGMIDILGSGEAVVLLRKSDNPRRKRFTLAHEIVHTLFPEWEVRKITHTDKEVGKYNKKNTVEYLCDVGASQLLFPRSLFKPKFKEVGFNSSALEGLANIFDASFEATSIAMVSQNPALYGVVVWKKKHKKAEQLLVSNLSFPGMEEYRPQKQLRIKFGYGLTGCGHIPRNKSLDEDGEIIDRSFESHEVMEGEETITFNKDFAFQYRVHTFPVVRNERIITLLEKIDSHETRGEI